MRFVSVASRPGGRGPHGLPIGILPEIKTGGVVSVSLQRPIFPFGWLPAPLSESREVPSLLCRLGDSLLWLGLVWSVVRGF